MTFDLAVVGAGPAGSSAAAFAVREGLSVAVLERCKFPRDKACGDGVTSPALNVLERLGLLDAIESGGFQQGSGFIFTSPGGIAFRCESPRVDGLRSYGYNVPRQVLDHLLVKRAVDLGAKLHEGFKVVEVIPSAVESGRIRGADGREVRARLVIMACGGLSPAVRVAGNSHLRRPGRNWCAAVRAYFEDVDGLQPGYPEIVFFPFSTVGYAWIFPMGPRRANIGVGTLARSSDKISHSLRGLFRRFVRSHTGAGGRLGMARQDGPLRGGLIPMGPLFGKTATDGMMLVGDAAGFADPLTGEGIYYALRSGEMAASQAVEALCKGDVSGKTLRGYEAKWRRGFGWNLWVGLRLRPWLAREALIERAFKRLALDHQGARRLAGVIGNLYPKKMLLSPSWIGRILFRGRG